MDTAPLALGIIAGLVLGFAIAAYFWSTQVTAPVRRQLDLHARRADEEAVRAQAAQARAGELEVRLAGAEAGREEQQKAAAEKLALLEEAEARLTQTFQSLATEALKSSNTQFLETARLQLQSFQQGATADLEKRQQAIDVLVKPIADTLLKVETKIQDVEKARIGAYEGLMEQVRTLASSQLRLQAETEKLVRALRAPNVRGRWGEIQLKRVVEIAGMVEYCDFTTQEHLSGDGGARRPDLVVRLPNSRCIAVDSKVPLEHYLGALECTDEAQRRALLSDHARQVRRHLQELGGKAYWDRLGQTPEFVVLFLPGEVFFSAALEHDPGLIEHGVEQRVILATPTTLIALLKAVAYGWRQEQVAKSAQEVAALGKQMYERLGVLVRHFEGVGKGLGRAVDAYNQAVGSLETRFLTTARRFNEMGIAAGAEIEPLSIVDKAPRSMLIAEPLDPMAAARPSLPLQVEPSSGPEEPPPV